MSEPFLVYKNSAGEMKVEGTRTSLVREKASIEPILEEQSQAEVSMMGASPSCMRSLHSHNLDQRSSSGTKQIKGHLGELQSNDRYKVPSLKMPSNKRSSL